MEFDLNSILTILSLIATGVVGFILSKQISAQKETIEMYRGLISDLAPQQYKEVYEIKQKLLEEINELNTMVLRKQHEELFRYVYGILWRQKDTNILWKNKNEFEAFVLHIGANCLPLFTDIGENIQPIESH